MPHSHVFDPEHIAVLESENRKLWQNPEEILSIAKLRSDWIAADLGCGSGYFTTILARQVKKVYAIDVQKEMLDYLAEKIKRLKIGNVELIHSEANVIPLEDQSVDFLISVNTLHEFDDRDKMIREMNRVIKPHGKLLIVDFDKKETGFGPPVSIRISKAQAVKLFSKSRWIPVTQKDLEYHYLLVFTKD
jgi:ubiquinone/menaquinone biosynthesis C-methylase UbiE